MEYRSNPGRQCKGVGDYELIRKMRGSICILGPLLARLQEARVPCPAVASLAPAPSIFT